MTTDERIQSIRGLANKWMDEADKFDAPPYPDDTFGYIRRRQTAVTLRRFASELYARIDEVTK